MRRNRKVKRESRWGRGYGYVGGLIVLTFAMGMMYWSQDAQCSSLAREIGELEGVYKRLDRDCQREQASWDELKSPDKLRVALIRHGLDMGRPNQDQVIHMSRAGRPDPNQMSVARIRQRRSQDVVADLMKDVRPVPRAGAGRRTARVRR